MIELKPSSFQLPICAFCGAENPPHGGALFGGHHVCVEVTCRECQRNYLADLPIGHALYTPGAVCLETFELRAHPDSAWFSRSLVAGARSYAAQRALPEQAPATAPVRVVRLKPVTTQAIIVSCIDYLYGHVLLKMLNIQAHLDAHPDASVIVILPKSFRWLVPEGVAEVWELDASLGRGEEWQTSLVAAATRELERFDSVRLSFVYGSPVPSQVDIERFTRVKPFPIERFTELPCQVTFVAREDRLWHASPEVEFCFKVVRRLTSNGVARRNFVHVQNARLARLCSALKEKLPEVKIAIVGIGHRSAPDFVEDLRVTKITDEQERRWCEVYARSHVVVGIHGSNMLLPSALAAGVVEILPDDRQGNILQDILSPWEGRKASFLVRFCSQNASIRELVAHIVGIYREYPVHCLQMDGTMLSHELVADTRCWQEAYAKAVAHSMPK